MIVRLAALFGLLLSVQALPAAAASLTLIEPYGAESSTGTAIGLIRAALSAKLGVPVETRTVAGDAGGAAQDAVAAAPADGSVLLVTQLLNPWAFKPHGTPGTDLAALVPVARLTTGLSATLFVAASSPIRSWEDFVAAAKAGPVPVGWNANLMFAIPMAMMENEIGVGLRDVVRHDRAGMIDAVVSGAAQAALLPTVSLLAHWPDARLRPILTFGGARNTALNVPTFREKTAESKKSAGKGPAITGSLAVFAPPGTPATVLARLGAAFVAAGHDGKVQADAKALRFPLKIAGPDSVRDAMTRDARIHRTVAGGLREPR